jgi:hypothetical protein
MLKNFTSLTLALLLSTTLVSCKAASTLVRSAAGTPVRWLQGLMGAARNTISQSDAPSTSTSAIAERGQSIQQRSAHATPSAAPTTPAAATASR